MNVVGLLEELRREFNRRAYYERLEVLEHTATLLKARLYISPSLFVQLYRNDHFETTNFVLIHNGQRLYARDQLGGRWHRHTTVAPNLHNHSAEGIRPVNLTEFLDEVETVLATLGLP
ncbi:MAG: hypothetical protein N2559_04125 [Anaerolineae bacterium]|nr:hypothetical protein [Anaerolineae bacterium]